MTQGTIYNLRTLFEQLFWNFNKRADVYRKRWFDWWAVYASLPTNEICNQSEQKKIKNKEEQWFFQSFSAVFFFLVRISIFPFFFSIAQSAFSARGKNCSITRLRFFAVKWKTHCFWISKNYIRKISSGKRIERIINELSDGQQYDFVFLYFSLMIRSAVLKAVFFYITSIIQVVRVSITGDCVRGGKKSFWYRVAFFTHNFAFKKMS